MREVVYKVWDESNKRFIDPSFFSLNEKGELGTFLSSFKFKDPRFILLQYTGITDRNNNPICEGDIVKLHRINSNLIGVVKWDLVSFIVDIENAGKPAQDTYYQMKYCEVIGNIFENPELLQ